MIFGLITIYLIISIIAIFLIIANGPNIEDFTILNIIKWKELNFFGKLFLIFITFPMTVIEYIIAGTKFIFTWHPRKKN